MNTIKHLLAPFIGILFFALTPIFAQTNEVAVNEEVTTENTTVSSSEVPIAAEFVYRIEECLLVIFTNTSIGAFEATFHWSFGDGDSSIFKDPIHRYETEGTYEVTLFAIDNAGKQVRITKNIEVGCDVGVGIPASEAYPNLYAYPNPAHQQVSLDLTLLPPTSNYEVSFFDVTGRQVHRLYPQNGLLSVPVVDWQSGVYFYQILDEQGVMVKNGRFVVD